MRSKEDVWCPLCEEYWHEWDVVWVESHPDYPRGTSMCVEHYEDEYPHDNCIVCCTKHPIHEMTPMGHWDGEPLYFCPSCAEAYPCLVKPEDKSATVQEFAPTNKVTLYPTTTTKEQYRA